MMKKVIALLLVIGMMATFMGFASATTCMSGCKNENCEELCACTGCKGDCCGGTIPSDGESQLPDFLQSILDFFKNTIMKAIEDLIAKITEGINGPSIG